MKRSRICSGLATAKCLAAKPSVEPWLRRTRRRSSSVKRADVVAALDEARGPWPNADG